MLTKTQPASDLKLAMENRMRKKRNGSRIRAQRTQKNTRKSASRHLWIHYKPLEKRPQEA